MTTICDECNDLCGPQRWKHGGQWVCLECATRHRKEQAAEAQRIHAASTVHRDPGGTLTMDDIRAAAELLRQHMTGP